MRGLRSTFGDRHRSDGPRVRNHPSVISRLLAMRIRRIHPRGALHTLSARRRIVRNTEHPRTSSPAGRLFALQYQQGVPMPARFGSRENPRARVRHDITDVGDGRKCVRHGGRRERQRHRRTIHDLVAPAPFARGCAERQEKDCKERDTGCGSAHAGQDRARARDGKSTFRAVHPAAA